MARLDKRRIAETARPAVYARRTARSGVIEVRLPKLEFRNCVAAKEREECKERSGGRISVGNNLTAILQSASARLSLCSLRSPAANLGFPVNPRNSETESFESQRESASIQSKAPSTERSPEMLLGLRACLKIPPNRRVRARGLQETAEIALGCRPGLLTGRISKQALSASVIVVSEVSEDGFRDWPTQVRSERFSGLYGSPRALPLSLCVRSPVQPAANAPSRACD